MVEPSRSRVREVLHKGNVRHVVVEKDGRRSVDLPVTVVVVAAILGIWVVGILLILALIGGYTIRVEDTEAERPQDSESAAGDVPASGMQPES